MIKGWQVVLTLLLCAACAAGAWGIWGSAPVHEAAPVRSSTTDAQVEVEIVPDKLIWRPFETITGKWVMRNVGTARFTMDWSDRPWVKVVDQAGQQPPALPNLTTCCGGMIPPPVVLDVGQSHEEEFSIMTDPLVGFGGFRLVQGRYRLTCEGLRTGVRAVPAAIRVQTEGRKPLTPRIVRFAAGNQRIGVLREDGTVESFDRSTGEMVCATRIDLGTQPHRMFSPWGCFDSRAERFACIVPSAGSPVTVEVYDLRSSSPLKQSCLLDVRPNAWVIGFHDVLGKLLISTQAGARAMNVETGELTLLPGNPHAVSPDGAWGVQPDQDGVVLRSICGTETRTLAEPATTNPFSGGAHLAGTQAVYVGTNGAEQVLMYDYAGELIGALPTSAYWPACESRDGRLVALCNRMEYSWELENDSARLEVWDTVSKQMVFAIADQKQRVPAFAGTSDELVCAINGSCDWLAHWHLDTFEVYEAATGKLLRKLTLKASTVME